MGEMTVTVTMTAHQMRLILRALLAILRCLLYGFGVAKLPVVDDLEREIQGLVISDLEREIKDLSGPAHRG